MKSSTTESFSVSSAAATGRAGTRPISMTTTRSSDSDLFQKRIFFISFTSLFGGFSPKNRRAIHTPAQFDRSNAHGSDVLLQNEQARFGFCIVLRASYGHTCTIAVKFPPHMSLKILIPILFRLCRGGTLRGFCIPHVLRGGCLHRATFLQRSLPANVMSVAIYEKSRCVQSRHVDEIATSLRSSQ